MRHGSIIFLLVATTAYAANVGPEGIDSLATELDGSGVLIGQAEIRRSGKAGYDSDNFSSSNTVPTGVYFQNNGGMASPDSFLDQHATLVAQQMVGTGIPSGVAPEAALHSIGISDINDDSQVALALNRLALLSSGLVKAINLSFYGLMGEFDDPDGNSHFTQFVDWSARQHDVLYVVAWGNITSPDEFRKPVDNFNGITVASSEQVDDGPYRKFSVVNWPDTDTSDAQRIDILAPGLGILVLPWNEVPTTEDGSSLAAPHVTGTVALLQQYADQQIGEPNPRFDFDSQRHQVMKAVMLNSADKLSGVHGSNRTVLDGMDNDWTESLAFGASTIPLDDEMGAGHLNARRAVEQLSPGEYDPGVVPSIGWDFHTIGSANARNEYIFDSEIGGGYIAATLAWDRQTEHTETCGNGLYCEGDHFFTGTLEERANNLDVYLLPAASNDLSIALTASVASNDTLEHIFFNIETPGMYKLVVVHHPFGGRGESDTYALAWWFGDAPPLPLSADYNNDGEVDAADYVLWRKGGPLQNEVETPGMVTQEDYDAWRARFGNTLGVGSSNSSSPAVPEPHVISLLIVTTVFVGGRRLPQRLP